jgi:hypothetical protein
MKASAELGSVHALERELATGGIKSKVRITSSGKQLGGQPFSRGALFHLLRNGTYPRQIVHREAVHEGEHDVIVDTALFDRVQQMLDTNARRHRSIADRRLVKAPLTGKLFDALGNPMSPDVLARQVRPELPLPCLGRSVARQKGRERRCRQASSRSRHRTGG